MKVVNTQRPQQEWALHNIWQYHLRKRDIKIDWKQQQWSANHEKKQKGNSTKQYILVAIFFHNTVQKPRHQSGFIINRRSNSFSGEMSNAGWIWS